MNLIEMNSICKSYRNIGFETKVLKDVTLHIKEGDYVSIIGPSGAGKSTLMAIMGCLAQPTSGEYILDYEEVGKLNDQKLSRVRNEKIGFVFVWPNCVIYDAFVVSVLCNIYNAFR